MDLYPERARECGANGGDFALPLAAGRLSLAMDSQLAHAHCHQHVALSVFGVVIIARQERTLTRKTFPSRNHFTIVFSATAPSSLKLPTRNKKKSDLSLKGKSNEAKKHYIRQEITNRVGGDRFGYGLFTDLHWPDTIGSGSQPLHRRMRGGSESAAIRLRPLRSTPPGSFTVLPRRAGGIPALRSQLPIA